MRSQFWHAAWVILALMGSAPTLGHASGFEEPLPRFRILKIIHSWPDDGASQDAWIRSLRTQGFGGVVCNVAFSEYLESPAKWQAFKRAVTESRQAGLALWLYDEKGYPSGTAGGQVLRGHPDWEARGLLVADTEISGGAVSLEVPPGKLFWAGAFEADGAVINLERSTNLAGRIVGGKLEWDPPKGRWRVMVMTDSPLFDGTHAAMSLSDHIPYPNLLDPEPTARFLQLTHERYAECLGDDLGRWFVATFTDEPSLMSLFLKRMPYRVLPWSAWMADEFSKRRGYDLKPKMPALVADAGPVGRRFRYDYWKTVGELVSSNYFGQIQRWCAKHNLGSGGHLLMEENLVNQVPLYGNFFQCLRRLDAPGIDCLTSIPEQVPWFIARLASSAAELEGKQVVMCETSDHSQRYRPPGDQRPVRDVTEEEIRGTCNRLIVNGVETITSYYSFAGLRDEQLRRLNDCVGRCCAALSGGHRVCDIAVVHPVESLWPKFVPARLYANASPAATRVESIFHDLSESLYSAGRDFSYIDSETLREAKVERGVLVRGDLRWRVVILPAVDTLPVEAWEKLAQFAESGGVVIALGSMPANSETEFPSRRVSAIGDRLFGKGEQARVTPNSRGGGGIYLPGGSVDLLPSTLDGFIEPDVRASDASARVRSTHRRIADREIYFLVNDSAAPWRGKVQVSGTGSGQRWDPASGSISPQAGGELELSLPGYGGVLFAFPSCRQPQIRPLAAKVFSQPSIEAIPCGDPLVARGEFVREQLETARDLPGLAAPGWKVRGSITRSDVDTFLFLRFPCTNALTLNDHDTIIVDSSVPQGQGTPLQLLVILHEQGGADYLAELGRTLGSPGYDQSRIPLHRFKLAGWSQDPNRRLDPQGITEIRIGWGGYYGQQGEKVEFTVGPPRRVLAGSARP